MTPEEKRIVIAEALGWKDIQTINNVLYGKDPQEQLHPNQLYFIPLFCSDLNAMHEAEKELEKRMLCVEYVNNLRDFANAPKTLSRYGLTHATAAQRADAFLLTLGILKS